MKCDIIADGVIAATKEVGLEIPLVVRLEGTNVELGKNAKRIRLKHYRSRFNGRWRTKIVSLVN